MKKFLVTGGAGFIGSHFIKYLLKNSDDISIINFDKLTYAGDLARLTAIEKDKRYIFFNGDLSDEKSVNDIFAKKIDVIIHFAAETHVDKSIQDSIPFEVTNIRGTLNLLNATNKFGVEKFINISTDEVYGALGETGQFYEDTPLNPNNPYSVSKSSADLFAKSYYHTYRTPVITIRPSNNYGAWQYPEKLIPLVIIKAMNNQNVPVYAKGENIREWLFVDDCVDGIFKILQNGRIGEVYNLGSGQEKRNLDVVKIILKILNKSENLIEFVNDRPGHDFRYSSNSNKIKKELNWETKFSFEEGIEATVKWYVENIDWIKNKRIEK